MGRNVENLIIFTLDNKNSSVLENNTQKSPKLSLNLKKVHKERIYFIDYSNKVQ